ncbi:MAG: hypothetical protein MJ228_02915 [Bacilli bacterium]|nr:hypothetical protein [Bacilli bacterium]
MGMKARSYHLVGNHSGGGESSRLGRFVIELQLFASNKPDSKMPQKGFELYNSAQNQSLKNQIAELYRPGSTTGDGGTADALRHEIETHSLVRGKSHYTKAKERVAALSKILKNGNLSLSDQKIAKMLIDDLNNALKGWKR